MPTPLYVNVNAPDIANALVRSATDLTPVSFAKLVVGDNKEYDLFFVDGEGGYAPWSGSGSYTPLIALGDCGNPSGGTFTLTFDGQTTPALAYNISPADLQAALIALSNIGPSDVAVSGVAGVYYKVVFGGTKADTDVAEITGDGALLTPASVVSVDTITPGGGGFNEVQLIQLRQNPISYADNWTPITNGWRGRLSTRTLEIAQKLAEESPLLEKLQITVQDPTGDRLTYLKRDAVIQCTIIDPEAFAGADKPTFATVAYVDSLALAGGVFTREAAASSAVGNTNITRPSGSHYHTALITVSGAADVTARTIAALTTNTPAAGDRIRLYFLNPATAGIILEVRNATSGGTLLATFTTDGTGRDCFVDLAYSGSAWQLVGDDTAGMYKDQNLAGLESIVTARANLGTLFSRLREKTASFTIAEADDGTLFRIVTGIDAIVATLPDPADVGDGWMCALLKSDSGTGTVATDPATEGLTAQHELMELRSDGTGWIVLYRIARQPAAVSAAVLNLPTLTGLAGGGSTNLDGLVTADGRYPVGTIVALSYDLLLQHWKLESSDSISDPPSGIVRPTDYATTTNEKVWKKIG